MRSSGDMWYYMEPASDGSENTSCYDGNFEYTFVVGQPRENYKSWSNVQLHNPRKNEIGDTDGLLGTIFNLRRSIADIFASAKDVTKSEVTLPDGTPGFRLVAPEVANATPGSEGKYIVAVTLDPAHDFLPCEVIATNPEEPNWSEHWKVREYRQVLDERSGKKRWFPVSGTLESADPHSAKMQVTIRDVRINGKLPSALFRPETPKGVTLLDCTSSGIDTAMAARLKLNIYHTPTLKEQIAAEFNKSGAWALGWIVP